MSQAIAYRDLQLAALAAAEALDSHGDTQLAAIVRARVNLAALPTQRAEHEDGAPAKSKARPPLASKAGAPSQSLSVEPLQFWHAPDCKCESARHGDHEPLWADEFGESLGNGCVTCLGTGFAGYCYLCAPAHVAAEQQGADDHASLDPDEDERTEHMQAHRHLEATRLVSKRVSAYQSCVRRICDSEACLERAIADLEVQAERVRNGRLA